jgi:tetratricopeptide (TPR) repeat protein
VRITAQLIEGATGSHLWAESYDRVLEDVFAVRDDVVATIVSTLAGQVEEDSRKRAATKSPANLTAYEHVLRGKRYRPDSLSGGSKDDFLREREEFERALELDPNCTAAYVALAHSYVAEFWYGSSWSPDLDAAGARAFDYACKAVALDDRDSQTHLILAWTYFDVKSKYELAEVQLQRTFELNPNDYNNYCALISFSMRTGDYEQGIAWANEAIRRNPFLPETCLSERGFSEYFAKQYDDAIKTFGIMLAPRLRLNVMGCIAACYAQLGRDEEARLAAAEFRERAEAEGTSDWDAESWQEYWSNLFVLDDPEPKERLLDGLRKAGLP